MTSEKPKKGQFQIPVRQIGDSRGIYIPARIADVLEAQPNTELQARLDTTKYGLCLKIWNLEQQLEKHRRENDE